MEESKAEKQNRMLKTLLLLLMVPVIAGIAIGAFYFIQKGMGSDTASANKSDLPTVKRDDPFSGKAPAADTNSSNSNTAPAATPTATPAPAASTPPPAAASRFPLVGRWVQTTPQGKITLRFEAPKKIGSSEMGRLITSAEQGKEYESVYEVVSSNQYRLKDEQIDCFFVIGADGVSLKLTQDGNTRYLTKAK